jgi:hypothetical protein
MFPPFCACGGGASPGEAHRRHQQRKLSMLRFWRDGLERQLAALDAAISTLQQQMQRDQDSQPQQ